MKKKQSSDYIQVKGSFKSLPEGVHVDTLNPDESIEVTVKLKRKASIEAALAKGERITHEEYESKYGSRDEDISSIEQFAHNNHLTIIDSSKSRRSVFLKGKVRDFETAFKVYLTNYRDKDGREFRGRTGHIHISADLDGIVSGVFGLDNRPMVTPKFRSLKREKFTPHVTQFNGYDPNMVGKIYGFPQTATGKGQCIGIIELGGGYRVNDLNNYFNELDIKMPSIKAVSVDGGFNNPTGNPNGADGEVMLDIEVAGSVAPGASFVVYFTKNDQSGKSFIDAITAAVHDKKNKPSVISISWGGPEDPQYSQYLDSFNETLQSAALLGVTVCVASGDDGANDGVTDGKAHVDFPASSPYVLACGGTKLEIKGSSVKSETVWNETKKDEGAGGGGVSEYFPVPAYQNNVKVPKSINTGFKGRGVPDVAGNADPETGFKVIVDGSTTVIGGTSGVAPLMAALVALLNEDLNKKSEKNIGFINPIIYKNPSAHCRDIIQGNNINSGTTIGFKAGKGWDACTGLGVLFK